MMSSERAFQDGVHRLLDVQLAVVDDGPAQVGAILFAQRTVVAADRIGQHRRIEALVRPIRVARQRDIEGWLQEDLVDVARRQRVRQTRLSIWLVDHIVNRHRKARVRVECGDLGSRAARQAKLAAGLLGELRHRLAMPDTTHSRRSSTGICRPNGKRRMSAVAGHALPAPGVPVIRNRGE